MVNIWRGDRLKKYREAANCRFGWGVGNPLNKPVGRYADRYLEELRRQPSIEPMSEAKKTWLKSDRGTMWNRYMNHWETESDWERWDRQDHDRTHDDRIDFYG